MAAPGREPQALDVRGWLIPTKPGGNGARHSKIHTPMGFRGCIRCLSQLTCILGEESGLHSSSPSSSSMLCNSSTFQVSSAGRASLCNAPRQVGTLPPGRMVHTQLWAEMGSEGRVQPLQTPVSNAQGWGSSGRCLLFAGCGLVGQSDNLDGRLNF